MAADLAPTTDDSLPPKATRGLTRRSSTLVSIVGKMGPPQVYVSITGLQVRRARDLPSVLSHSARAMAQAHSAPSDMDRTRACRMNADGFPVALPVPWGNQAASMPEIL